MFEIEKFYIFKYVFSLSFNTRLLQKTFLSTNNEIEELDESIKVKSKFSILFEEEDVSEDSDYINVSIILLN